MRDLMHGMEPHYLVVYFFLWCQFVKIGFRMKVHWFTCVCLHVYSLHKISEIVRTGGATLFQASPFVASLPSYFTASSKHSHFVIYLGSWACHENT